MAASTRAPIFVVPAKAGTRSALARGRSCYAVLAFAGMAKEGEGC